ncbi:tellurite resistance TerB family protein [Halopseudomonas nanhaiensis]|uniref:tellurite resistance TerB family protein n=1 Tax=Halopseudomonas nanhaiensis TaxID=2830842 RepID=UPI001CBFAF91|nr:tellurite resistance TerB family protein [Halopseudomonas nanhaiensis]UAW99628.1 tellurite resistance TerB family protein [Halopseudomonas nanhaiensis]
MNTRSLLDQLLTSGKDLLQNQGSSPSTQRAGSGSGSGIESALGGLLGSVGGGALGGGAISLLMGSKKTRKMGGKVITYGGLAALGLVAYKAYSNWQSQKEVQTGMAQPDGPLRTVDRVPPAEIEQHSQAILRAIIGAAKADGHIDDREREMIDGEINKLTPDPELKRWFDQELRKPLDPSDVARSAQTPEIAAEMYVASILMVDDQNFMERTYLDELARQLKLDPELKSELETQAAENLQ